MHALHRCQPFGSHCYCAEEQALQYRFMACCVIPTPASPRHRSLAWSVHAFTFSTVKLCACARVRVCAVMPDSVHLFSFLRSILMHSGVRVHFVPLTQGLVSHASSLDVAGQCCCCCCQAQMQRAQMQ